MTLRNLMVFSSDVMISRWYSASWSESWSYGLDFCLYTKLSCNSERMFHRRSQFTITPWLSLPRWHIGGDNRFYHSYAVFSNGPFRQRQRNCQRRCEFICPTLGNLASMLPESKSIPLPDFLVPSGSQLV